LPLFGPKEQVGSTQDALAFAEIHDDTIILKDGNLRQILLCASINFSLKSEQEQNAIIFQYQNFLNSLDFPIQIVMQSKKLDLSHYLSHLEGKANKQTNELLRMQTLDYTDFIKKLINIANIMDKRFYVVVPFMVPPKITAPSMPSKLPGAKGGPKAPQMAMTPEEFANHKKELERRVQTVESGLGAIGVRTALLNTQQIIELLYAVYNPEEAAKEKLIDADQLSGDIIESELSKPVEEKPTPQVGVNPSTSLGVKEEDGESTSTN